MPRGAFLITKKQMSNIFGKIVVFLQEVKTETKRVTWPTKEQTIKYTLLVIGVSVVFAIFLGGVDFAFTEFINKLISSKP